MKKVVTGLILFALASLNVNSQHVFYSQSLQNLYYSLPASCRLNTIVADTVIHCSEIVPNGAAPITFSWDKYEMMEHIGYRFLQDDTMWQSFNPAVVRFLEREILSLLTTDNLNQKLAINRDNGMLIALNGNTPQTNFYRSRTGLPNLLQRVSGMEVRYEDEKRYRVDIHCGAGQTLMFTFVADAELLSDMDKKERDDRIAAQLSHHRAKAAYSHVRHCSDEAIQVHNDSAFVCKGNMFIIPQINGNLYYTKSDDTLRLAFGRNWIAETLSNAMLAPFELNYSMQVTQRLYGGIIHGYEVNSRDFFDYFSDEYERFFGIETVDRDILTGTLVLADKNVGNIHLAFVSVSIWDLLNGGTMKIQLDANIPQHNVETLFGRKSETRGEPQFNINIR